MKPAISPLKFICVSLASIILVEAVFAHKPEVNFWMERNVSLRGSPQGDRSNLPFLAKNDGLLRSARNDSSLSQFGTLRTKSQSSNVSNSQTIIHVQDIHQNTEAQENIAAAVRTLLEEGKVDLIALEGAFGPIDLEYFQKFSRRDAVKNVADYLLREHRISGPVYALLNNAHSVPVIGIDDKTHYDLNVAAVRAAEPLRKSQQEKLAAQKKGLFEKKARVFNKELLTFDAMVESHRDGKLNLGDYVEALAEQGVELSLEVETFLEAFRLEKAMNQTRVEHERAVLVEKLVAQLSPVEVERLGEISMAFKAGRIDHAEFYAYLKNLCLVNKISLDSFPAMHDYIQYVLLSEGINGEKLTTDLQNLEKAVYRTLARTKDEQNLIAESRRHYLAARLVDFALTREEWREHEASHATIACACEVFDVFYQEAELRDRLMAENLERAIKKHDAKNVVLVTGGFHASGIQAVIASEAKQSVVSFVPKITKLDEKGSQYLSVFTQKKTPLDKVFAGEKLFLAGSPAVAPGSLKKSLYLNVLPGKDVQHEFGSEKWAMAKDAATGAINSMSVLSTHFRNPVVPIGAAIALSQMGLPTLWTCLVVGMALGNSRYSSNGVSNFLKEELEFVKAHADDIEELGEPGLSLLKAILAGTPVADVAFERKASVHEILKSQRRALLALKDHVSKKPTDFEYFERRIEAGIHESSVHDKFDIRILMQEHPAVDQGHIAEVLYSHGYVQSKSDPALFIFKETPWENIDRSGIEFGLINPRERRDFLGAGTDLRMKRPEHEKALTSFLSEIIRHAVNQAQKKSQVDVFMGQSAAQKGRGPELFFIVRKSRFVEPRGVFVNDNEMRVQQFKDLILEPRFSSHKKIPGLALDVEVDAEYTSLVIKVPHYLFYGMRDIKRIGRAKGLAIEGEVPPFAAPLIFTELESFPEVAADEPKEPVALSLEDFPLDNVIRKIKAAAKLALIVIAGFVGLPIWGMVYEAGDDDAMDRQLVRDYPELLDRLTRLEDIALIKQKLEDGLSFERIAIANGKTREDIEEQYRNAMWELDMLVFQKKAQELYPAKSKPKSRSKTKPNPQQALMVQQVTEHLQVLSDVIEGSWSDYLDHNLPNLGVKIEGLMTVRDLLMLTPKEASRRLGEKNYERVRIWLASLGLIYGGYKKRNQNNLFKNIVKDPALLQFFGSENLSNSSISKLKTFSREQLRGAMGDEKFRLFEGILHLAGHILPLLLVAALVGWASVPMLLLGAALFSPEEAYFKLKEAFERAGIKNPNRAYNVTIAFDSWRSDPGTKDQMTRILIPELTQEEADKVVAQFKFDELQEFIKGPLHQYLTHREIPFDPDDWSKTGDFVGVTRRLVTAAQKLDPRIDIDLEKIAAKNSPGGFYESTMVELNAQLLIPRGRFIFVDKSRVSILAVKLVETGSVGDSPFYVLEMSPNENIRYKIGFQKGPFIILNPFESRLMSEAAYEFLFRSQADAGSGPFLNYVRRLPAPDEEAFIKDMSEATLAEEERHVRDWLLLKKTGLKNAPASLWVRPNSALDRLMKIAPSENQHGAIIEVHGPLARYQANEYVLYELFTELSILRGVPHKTLVSSGVNFELGGNEHRDMAAKYRVALFLSKLMGGSPEGYLKNPPTLQELMDTLAMKVEESGLDPNEYARVLYKEVWKENFLTEEEFQKTFISKKKLNPSSLLYILTGNKTLGLIGMFVEMGALSYFLFNEPLGYTWRVILAYYLLHPIAAWFRARETRAPPFLSAILQLAVFGSYILIHPWLQITSLAILFPLALHFFSDLYLMGILPSTQNEDESLRADPGSKAFVMDGLMHQLDRVALNEVPFEKRQGVKDPLRPEELIDAQMRAAYDKAVANLEEVFRVMAIEFSPAVAEEVRKTLSIHGVYSVTRGFVARFFSPKYRWGMLRNSRGRQVVYVPIVAFGKFTSAWRRRWLAFSLVQGLEWAKRYNELTVGPEKHSAVEIHEAMHEFDREWRKKEKKYLPLEFYLLHIWSYVLDRFTLWKLHLRLEWRFWRVKQDTAVLRREAEKILSSDEYVNPETGVLDRNKVKVGFGHRIEEVVRLGNALEAMAYEAMTFGDYEKAYEMVRWANYLFIFDSGILPIKRYLLMMHILVRTQRYRRLRQAIVNLREEEIRIQINVGKIERTVVLGLDPSEISLFLEMAKSENFYQWTEASLLRQAEIVTGMENRRDILRVRRDTLHQLERLFQQNNYSLSKKVLLLAVVFLPFLSGCDPMMIMASIVGMAAGFKDEIADFVRSQQNQFPRLQPGHSTVLKMYFLGRRSVEEIARILGIEVDSVRKRMQRGIEALQNFVNPSDESAEKFVREHRRRFKGLPREQESVLHLRFIKNNKVREIAHKMKTSEGTVKTRIALGIANLRRVVEEEIITPRELVVWRKHHLGKLKPHQEAVLRDRYIENRSVKEIAQGLGIGRASAAKRIDRALEDFRKLAAPPEGSVEKLVLDNELHLEKLTPKQEAVLRGLYIDGQDGRKLASEMGLSPSAVSNIRSRGIEKLAALTGYTLPVVLVIIMFSVAPFSAIMGLSLMFGVVISLDQLKFNLINMKKAPEFGAVSEYLKKQQPAAREQLEEFFIEHDQEFEPEVFEHMANVLGREKWNSDSRAFLSRLVLFLRDQFDVYLAGLQKPKKRKYYDPKTFPKDPEKRERAFRNQLYIIRDEIVEDFFSYEPEKKKAFERLEEKTGENVVDWAAEMVFSRAVRGKDAPPFEIFAELLLKRDRLYEVLEAKLDKPSVYHLKNIRRISEKSIKKIAGMEFSHITKLDVVRQIYKDPKVHGLFDWLLKQAGESEETRERILEYQAITETFYLKAHENSPRHLNPLPIIHQPEVLKNEPLIIVGADYQGVYFFPYFRSPGRPIVIVEPNPTVAKFLIKAAMVYDIDTKISVVSRLPEGNAGLIYLAHMAFVRSGSGYFNFEAAGRLLPEGGQIVFEGGFEQTSRRYGADEMMEKVLEGNAQEILKNIRQTIANRNLPWTFSHGTYDPEGHFAEGYSGYAKPFESPTLFVLTKTAEKSSEPVIPAVQLTDHEIVRYFGEGHLGKTFLVRQLDPEKDLTYVQQWKEEFEADAKWQEAWKERQGVWAEKLPRFTYIAPFSMGLFSRDNEQERLEGHLGGQLIPHAYSPEQRAYTNSVGVQQMELYYKNIGHGRVLPNVADLLFDYLIKIMHESPQFSGGIEMNAVTPGGKVFMERRLVDVLTGFSVQDIARDYVGRSLETLFKFVLGAAIVLLSISTGMGPLALTFRLPKKEKKKKELEKEKEKKIKHRTRLFHDRKRDRPHRGVIGLILIGALSLGAGWYLFGYLGLTVGVWGMAHALRRLTHEERLAFTHFHSELMEYDRLLEKQIPILANEGKELVEQFFSEIQPILLAAGERGFEDEIAMNVVHALQKMNIPLDSKEFGEFRTKSRTLKNDNQNKYLPVRLSGRYLISISSEEDWKYWNELGIEIPSESRGVFVVSVRRVGLVLCLSIYGAGKNKHEMHDYFLGEGMVLEPVPVVKPDEISKWGAILQATFKKYFQERDNQKILALFVKAQKLAAVAIFNYRREETDPLRAYLSAMKMPLSARSIAAWRHDYRTLINAPHTQAQLSKMNGRTYLYAMKKGKILALLRSEKHYRYNEAFVGQILSMTVSKDAHGYFLAVYGVGPSPRMLDLFRWNDEARRFENSELLVDAEDIVSTRIPEVQLPEPLIELTQDKYSLDDVLELTGLKRRVYGEALLRKIQDRGLLANADGSFTTEEVRWLIETARKLYHEEYPLAYLVYRMLGISRLTHEAVESSRDLYGRIFGRLFSRGGNVDTYLPYSSSQKSKSISREDAFFIWAERWLIERAGTTIPAHELKRNLETTSLEEVQRLARQTRAGHQTWFMKGKELHWRAAPLQQWMKDVYDTPGPLPKHPAFLVRALRNQISEHNGQRALFGYEAMDLLGLSQQIGRKFHKSFAATKDDKPLWVEKRGHVFYLQDNLLQWRDELLSSQTVDPFASAGELSQSGIDIVTTLLNQGLAPIAHHLEAAKSVGVAPSQYLYVIESFNSSRNPLVIYRYKRPYFLKNRLASLVTNAGQMYEGATPALKTGVPPSVLERLRARGLLSQGSFELTPEETQLLANIARQLRHEEYELPYLAYQMLAAKNPSARELYDRLQPIVSPVNKTIYFTASPNFENTRLLSREDAFFILAEQALLARAGDLGTTAVLAEELGVSHSDRVRFKGIFGQTRDGHQIWVMIGQDLWFRMAEVRRWIAELYESDEPLPERGGVVAHLLQSQIAARNTDKGPVLRGYEAMKFLGLDRQRESSFQNNFSTTKDGKPLWVEKRGHTFYFERNLAQWRDELLSPQLSDPYPAGDKLSFGGRWVVDHLLKSGGSELGPILNVPSAMKYLGLKPGRARSIIEIFHTEERPLVVYRYGSPYFIEAALVHLKEELQRVEESVLDRVTLKLVQDIKKAAALGIIGIGLWIVLSSQGQNLFVFSMFALNFIVFVMARSSFGRKDSHLKFLRDNQHVFGELEKLNRNLLRLILLGRTRKEIAAELNIALGGIENRRANAIAELQTALGPTLTSRQLVRKFPEEIAKLKNEAHRNILSERFLEDKALHEVAKERNVSVQQLAVLEAQALRALRVVALDEDSGGKQISPIMVLKNKVHFDLQLERVQYSERLAEIVEMEPAEVRKFLIENGYRQSVDEEDLYLPRKKRGITNNEFLVALVLSMALIAGMAFEFHPVVSITIFICFAGGLFWFVRKTTHKSFFSTKEIRNLALVIESRVDALDDYRDDGPFSAFVDEIALMGQDLVRIGRLMHNVPRRTKKDLGRFNLEMLFWNMYRSTFLTYMQFALTYMRDEFDMAPKDKRKAAKLLGSVMGQINDQNSLLQARFNILKRQIIDQPARRQSRQGVLVSPVEISAGLILGIGISVAVFDPHTIGTLLSGLVLGGVLLKPKTRAEVLRRNYLYTAIFHQAMLTAISLLLLVIVFKTAPAIFPPVMFALIIFHVLVIPVNVSLYRKRVISLFMPPLGKVYTSFFKWVPVSKGGMLRRIDAAVQRFDVKQDMAGEEFWKTITPPRNVGRPVRSREDLARLILFLTRLGQPDGVNGYGVRIDNLMIEVIQGKISVLQGTNRFTTLLLHALGIKQTTIVRERLTPVIIDLLARYKRDFSNRYLIGQKEPLVVAAPSRWRHLGFTLFQSDLTRFFFSNALWFVVGILLGGVAYLALFYFVIRRFLRPIYEALVINWARVLRFGGSSVPYEPFYFGVARVFPGTPWDEIRRAYYDLESLRFGDEIAAPWARLLLYQEVLSKDPTKAALADWVGELRKSTVGLDEPELIEQIHRLRYEHRISFWNPAALFVFEILRLPAKPLKQNESVLSLRVLTYRTIYRLGRIPFQVGRAVALMFNLRATERFVYRMSNGWALFMGQPTRPHRSEMTGSRLGTQVHPLTGLDKKNESLRAELLQNLRNLGIPELEPVIKKLKGDVTVKFEEFRDTVWSAHLLNSLGRTDPQKLKSTRKNMVLSTAMFDLQNKTLVLSSLVSPEVNILAAIKLVSFGFRHQVIHGERQNIHMGDPDLLHLHALVLKKLLLKHWLSSIRLIKGKMGPAEQKNTSLNPDDDSIFHFLQTLFLYSHMRWSRVYSAPRQPGILFTRSHSLITGSFTRTRESLMISIFYVASLFVPGLIGRTNQRAFNEEPKRTHLRAVFWGLLRPALSNMGMVMVHATWFMAIFGGIILHIDLSYFNDVLIYFKDLLIQIDFLNIGAAIAWVWDIAVSVFELLSAYFAAPIAYVKQLFVSFWDALEPVRHITETYIVPVFYALVIPGLFFVFGTLSGYMFYRMKLGRRIWREGHLWLAFGINFLIGRAANLWEIIFDPIDPVAVERVQQFVVNAFVKTRYVWSVLLMSLFVFIHWMGIHAYIATIGFISYPHMNMKTFFLYLQGLGIPVTPMVWVIVSFFFISATYSWFYRLFEIFVRLTKPLGLNTFPRVRAAFFTWLSGLFVVTVITPPAVNYMLRENPIRSKWIMQHNEDVAVNFWNKLSRELDPLTLERTWVGARQNNRKALEKTLIEKGMTAAQIEEAIIKIEEAEKKFDWSRFRAYAYGRHFEGLPELVDPTTGLARYKHFFATHPDLVTTYIHDDVIVPIHVAALWLEKNKGILVEEIQKKNPAVYKNAHLIAGILTRLGTEKIKFYEILNTDKNAGELDVIMGSLIDAIQDPPDYDAFSANYRQQYFTIRNLREILTDMYGPDYERYRAQVLKLDGAKLYGDNRIRLEELQAGLGGSKKAHMISIYDVMALGTALPVFAAFSKTMRRMPVTQFIVSLIGMVFFTVWMLHLLSGKPSDVQSLMFIPLFFPVLLLQGYIHEYGHYFAAKKLGYRAKVVSRFLFPKYTEVFYGQGTPPTEDYVAVLLSGPVFHLTFGLALLSAAVLFSLNSLLWPTAVFTIVMALINLIPVQMFATKSDGLNILEALFAVQKKDNRAEEIKAALRGTPLNLGVGVTTMAEALRKTREIDDNPLDVVFVDKSLAPKLKELVAGLSPNRQVVLVAESAEITTALNKLVDPDIHVINGSDGIFQPNGIHLAEFEALISRKKDLYWQVEIIMKGNQGINVISSAHAPEFVFESLGETSIFVRETTNYLIIDELLKVLAAFRAMALEDVLKSGWKALIAA